ncbi:Hypothetical predicted protein [Octopus vulgaris]|uniref:Uncharacterized protein n=1 Tax=Octopus vulgaris TaxID=6645 RepID=A0AA36AM04_OCTVU|nr:Hypothetical predicted protein [Octopus vulgaris]
MTQTNTFLERMDKRRQGLWADREEPEVMDGSALEDRCWTGDSDGPVGGDCPSNEASNEMDNEGSGPEKPCDMEPVEVEKTEKPAECVMADAVVPCLEPLASRPLSLGARDEELAKSGSDIAGSEVPALCVMVAAGDVPCASPLVSGPLSLGAQKDCMVPNVERTGGRAYVL